MRVLIVVDSLNGGGAELVCLRLLREMRKQGIETNLVSILDHTDYPVEDGEVHYLTNNKKPGSFGFRRKVAKRLKAFCDSRAPYNLVLAHLRRSCFATHDIQLPNTYYVVHNAISGSMHTAGRGLGLRKKPLFELLDIYTKGHVITVSKGVAEGLKTAGCNPLTATPIYNPFDIPAIREKADQPVDDIPEGRYIVHVGRTARQKRHDVLLKAFAQIDDPSLKLLLLTHKPEKLEKLINELGIQDRVIAKHFTSNPYPYMKHATIMALSSDHEGFPSVPIESLAVGTPVVSTLCPHGPDEILTGPLAKWLVPMDDPTALAEKIKECLASPPDVTHAPILNEVDPTQVVAQYLALAK